jgi:hypothetical protein
MTRMFKRRLFFIVTKFFYGDPRVFSYTAVYNLDLKVASTVGKFQQL